VRSLNVATVQIAQQVDSSALRGWQTAGMSSDIRPTPAMALGAYELTPLEVAASYTAFANSGAWCEPASLRRVVGPEGEILRDSAAPKHRVLIRASRTSSQIFLRTSSIAGPVPACARVIQSSRGGEDRTSHDGCSWIYDEPIVRGLGGL